MTEEKLSKKILKVLTNRLLILFVCFCIMFYLLVMQLFRIQIIDSGSYYGIFSVPSFRNMTTNAQRGEIYDRYGRPLAVNETSMILKIDPAGIEMGDVNQVVYDLVKLLERNGEVRVDDFPISPNKPYVFLFDGSESREKKWKKDMEVPENLSAEESIAFLREKFALPEELTDTEARKVLGLRSEVYLKRYRKEDHITVSFGIKTETLVAVEENNELFPGVYADYDFSRHYPEGIYLSHIVGYIRGLTTEEELAEFGEGYSYGMLVGKSGIEKSFEKELSGTKGSKLVEVSNSGRELRSITISEATQGNKVFLTIDAELQKKCYTILEDTLREVLVNKIRGVSKKEDPIPPQQVFTSLIKSNTISTKEIYEAPDDSLSVKIRDYLRQELPEVDITTDSGVSEAKEVLTEAIKNGKVTPYQMTSVLYDQGYVVGDESYISRFLRGGISVVNVIVDCLENRTITPQMTGLDPCTGSVIIVDNKTGDVLAASGYPSFDTNEYVNTFNYDYYLKQLNDPTFPSLNRPFSEPRAPGSTFKMIPAIAGLETGTITARSTFYDYTSFEKAGRPFTKCWSGVSHGAINVSTALEVSCNYFFCEMTYAMGNAKKGNENDSINALMEYMIDFGFNDPTGVEIGERNQGLEEGHLVISSPEYKAAVTLGRDPNAAYIDYAWYDGDTVRTAMGQANNNYTAANMAKYITTLATGGIRYKFNLINKVETHKNELVKKYEPVVENVVELKQETLDTVYKGMLAVTSGSRGTAAEVFKGFPIKVAGKTGTAQESDLRNDHSSFGGFAPYDDPQIAVYVLLPFGSTQAMPHASAVVARKVFGVYFGLDAQPERSDAVNVLTP